MLRPNAPTTSSPLEIPPYQPRSAPVPAPSSRPHATGYTTQQHPSSHRSLRPSTAPAASKSHEDLIWLPAAQSPPDYSDESQRTEQDSPRPLQTLVEEDAESRLGKWANLVFDHERAADGDVYSLNPSQSQDTSPMPSTGDATPSSGSNDYDWAAFIIAYAEGRWDPHKIPSQPQSCHKHVLEPRVSHSVGPSTQSHPDGHIPDPPPVVRLDSPPTTEDQILPPLPSPEPRLPVISSAPKPSSFPLRLPSSAHRFRSSFSAGQNHSFNHSQAAISDVQASVAAMRWAASRVDISPLALPSPEHELTDPLRGVTATIPGAHPNESTFKAETPGAARRSRLIGFWEGTTDVENQSTPSATSPTAAEPLPDWPDAAEPGQTPPSIASGEAHPPAKAALPGRSVHPASAPLLDPRNDDTDSISNADYFGNVSTPIPVDAGYHGSASSDSVLALPQEPLLPTMLRVDAGMSDISATTVPAVSVQKRINITRQTSSPLPDSASHAHAATHLRPRAPSDNPASAKLGRAIKEERMFAALQYLCPPYPSDELDRRRALHKFNIWNTGADINFDRIAHLAKLVFSTKGVIISLIDGHEQWFKSEWGIKTPSYVRSQSFGGHSILQRGDEPMIVLDSTKDWRFAKNPLVIGPPYVRFYAGAPLRTQDGFNIGTLAVIDDQPRDVFSPRQRHTLKEFAAVAMREMELWRDKIQLRIRDRIQSSMEQFSRECLEIDTPANQSTHPDAIGGSSMDKVYDRAAKLVKRTLDVEGVTVMDVSHCEVLESMSAEGSVSVTMHYGHPGTEMTRRQLTTEEYRGLNTFFEKYPDGKVSEGIIPPSFKPFLPTHIQYALIVPIFNIDKRPFALVCAYNTQEHPTRFLEGHELSYLRAIGVIILSAVLKRRMLLADKAKGLFISNISHELRTPLHGILAAAELLSESSLNHSQASFLQTVQACGTSLVETVNHVLDFTKLSGNSKAGGVENVIVPTLVDLMQLVENAVDGCWIGHRARMTSTEESGIGSVYSPPREILGSPMATRRKNVETVLDIGFRAEGWNLKCEKAGMRRVLMNLFGNSLKFTTDGYIHVILRQLPRAEDDPPGQVKIELAVFDTGKGISQNFLKNQLFHPFSQENPLQTGTGLGLAIVSSIVTSENVGGKVDVWSEEGVGTEIKVTFPAEIPDTQTSTSEMGTFRAESATQPLPTVSLVGFTSHRGSDLLRRVTTFYLTEWWGFTVVEEGGDILVVNDDPAPVIAATQERNTRRAFIILSAARGSPQIMGIASEHESIGGFCRILYKPGGPARLRAILKLSIHALRMSKPGAGSPSSSPPGLVNGDASAQENGSAGQLKEAWASPTPANMSRRNSNGTPRAGTQGPPKRPGMPPRSSTAHPFTPDWAPMPLTPVQTPPDTVDVSDPDTSVPTIVLGTGGTLLKSSVGALVVPAAKFRVLIVEDNSILRNLLMKWLSSKGYDFSPAVDGRDGVNVFREQGPFNVVLLDLSMPVLDGVGATIEIRNIEAELLEANPDYQKSQILALTGMSSLEDKRRAFEAGVDGYLVKPVAFKTLDEMFHKLCNKPAE